ncbi:MAG: hypothetical protein KatS3mg058_2336 [Roseiflexus sp.]|nr:MAG: hypothetical protein KatS3mg058_2336 [Roseiflexus sp.]
MRGLQIEGGKVPGGNAAPQCLEMLNVYKECGRAYHALLCALCASVVQKRRREESYLEGGQEGCRWKAGLIETRINEPISSASVSRSKMLS